MIRNSCSRQYLRYLRSYSSLSSSPEYAFEMAASSIRFGRGSTKEIGYDFDMSINLEDLPDGVVLLTGLEKAIVGITEGFGGIFRIMYSRSKIIEILQNRDEMTEDEAYEFYTYNILGMHVCEQNPIFLVD